MAKSPRRWLMKRIVMEMAKWTRKSSFVSWRSWAATEQTSFNRYKDIDLRVNGTRLWRGVCVCKCVWLHLYIHIDRLPHGTATSDPSWRDSKYIGQFLKVLLYSYKVIQLQIYIYIDIVLESSWRARDIHSDDNRELRSYEKAPNYIHGHDSNSLQIVAPSSTLYVANGGE